VLPFESAHTIAVYHLFVVRVQNREKLMKHLASAGVGTAIHYPIPLHLQNAYKDLGYKSGDFPVAEKVAPEIVSLPMFPGLNVEQQHQVVEEISNFVATGAAAMAAVG
jgi:dTDP-4-amino-4,6-dideoxygalactose transaminase